jgi:DNA polymerase-4
LTRQNDRSSVEGGSPAVALDALEDEAVPDHGPRLPRRIAHFDLDAFFVSVECAKDPSLRGKPVLIGHAGGRGVVATASYEARRFGCHSAQPMVQALRLCPQAIIVPPDFASYRSVSARFHEMLHETAPIVESVGIDEAYADLTGLAEPAGRDVSGGFAAAEALRARVHAELDVAVSVCIAGSRTTAKVGSDRAKPDGLIEVPVGGDAAFLAPFAIRELPLVGPKLGEALARAGVRTIGQAAELDRRWLARQFGRAGEVLADHARGIDATPVNGNGRVARSISREVTFGEDVEDVGELERVLARHAERVGTDLRESGKRARTVTL